MAFVPGQECSELPSLTIGAPFVVTCVGGTSGSLEPWTLTVTVAGSAAAAFAAASRSRRQVARTARGMVRALCMEPTPFHEGLWASVGGRSPGSRAYPPAPSHSAVAVQWLALCPPAPPPAGPGPG